MALKPAESPEIIKDYADIVDMVLIMTVEPGFGGQSFMSDMLGKISAVRDMLESRGRDVDIQVDGGINTENARLCAKHGANVFVAGTALFGADDMQKEIGNMRRRIN